MAAKVEIREGPSELGLPASLATPPTGPLPRWANGFSVSFSGSIFALNDCAS